MTAFEPSTDAAAGLSELTDYARTGSFSGDPGQLVQTMMSLGGGYARMAAWASWSAGEPLSVGPEPCLLEFGSGEPTREMLAGIDPFSAVESLMLGVLHEFARGEQPALPVLVDSLVSSNMERLPESTIRLVLQVYGRLGRGGLEQRIDQAADGAIRTAVLRYLAETGGAAGIDDMSSPVPLQRIYAARSLPVGELGQLLSDPLWAVRYEAAGRVDVSLLPALLADPDPYVGLRAASRMKQEGIEGFHDRAGELALLPGPVGNQAVSLLGAEDEDLIALLMRSGEPGRRLAAVEAWLGAGLSFNPEMEEDLLRDPYWIIPAVLIENMAASGDTIRAGETARRLLATSDDRDLRQALAGFLETGLPEGESRGDLPEGLSGFRTVQHATIHTDQGDIELQLMSDFAPVTCSAFCWLAWNGFYDGLYFHRVIPGFVAQAGCPQGNGLGGPGFSLPNERSLMRFRRGVVGMADSGLDTGGSQFFIMLDDHDRLDCRYTAFAAVAGSDSILDRITVGTRIESVSLEGPGD